MGSTGWEMNDPRLEFRESDHSYHLGDRKLVSVTQALALVGIADFSSPWFTDAVKDRGTYLHEAIALDVEDALEESTLHPDLRGGIDGWRKFLSDTGAVVEHWEVKLCDPLLGVAGRMDGIVKIADEKGREPRYLIDVKRALYPSAAIQLAGYADMAARLYDQPVYFKRAVLELPGDGSYRFHRMENPLDRATWQACVRIVQWRQEHGI